MPRPKRRWGRLLLWFAGVGVAIRLGWPLLPPDLQRAPTYVSEFLTKENGTVNTPLMHEMFGLAMGVPDAARRDHRLRVAAGWKLSVFATDIPHPRMLRITSTGGAVVSQPRKGRVLWLAPDADGDGKSDAVRIVAEGLELPHGLELVPSLDGADLPWLYVAEPWQLLRAPLDVQNGTLESSLELVAPLPKTHHHHFRTVQRGPDGWLYLPIGSNCNSCEPTDPREQAILRMRTDGRDEEVYATGFRNIIGFDWRPSTGALYAIDIGADYLGDDFPPEELNRIERGAFYGFPYAHGARVPDPEHGAGHQKEIRESVPPVHTFDAHSTPLGLAFLRQARLPPTYEGAAVVSLHGSWNRTRKTGHALVSLHWDADGTIRQRPLVVGFELDEDVVGRPVDVAEGPDGSIYFSDDYAGAVYRLQWVGTESPAAAVALPSNSAPPSAHVAVPAPGDSEREALGARLFAERGCVACHTRGGAAGSPDSAYVPLDGLGERYSKEGIADLLAAPPPAMPRIPLDTGERSALAAYLLR